MDRVENIKIQKTSKTRKERFSYILNSSLQISTKIQTEKEEREKKGKRKKKRKILNVIFKNLKL